MEIDFINHWKHPDFFQQFSLVEFSYESLNLTTVSQRTVHIVIFGLGISFWWKKNV